MFINPPTNIKPPHQETTTTISGLFFKHSVSGAGTPSWMRPTYLALSTLLGLITSIGAHAVIEMWWLSFAPSHGFTLHWTTFFGMCSLPLWIQISLPVVGITGGFITGHIWWRWVYVERRWEKKMMFNKTQS